MPAKATVRPKVNGKKNGGSAARNAAIKRLVESYPETWETYLKEEREKLGLPESTKKRSRLQVLRDQLVAAGQQPLV